MPAEPVLIERRYTLESQVGRGAFGEVYRGTDRETGEPVAIKRLLGNLGDPVAADRFDREARLIAQVQSPYVVRYIGHGLDREGQPCLVLEWLEGEDLKRRQAWRPLQIHQAIEAARQVALGLDALHAAGIIHRDIKPSNFFLLASRDDSLHIKLIDLGTARGGGEASLTVEGWAVGTPAYMSPEQARGEASITPRSDLFSLGVVLFELLSGRRPFRGADNYAVLAKIVLEDAPRLAGFVAGVSPELDEIVARAMAKRAEQRFRSARDMAEALELAKALPIPMAMAATEEHPTEVMRATDGPTVALSVPHVSTLQEQRVVTAVFAAFGQADVEPAMQAFATTMAERGGVVHATLGSRMIGVFGGARSSGDEVVRAAHAALTAAGAIPGLRVAIATGRVHADAEGVAGEAIERGATMLERESGAVRVDTPSARLLLARFVIEGDEGDEVLITEREVDDLPQTLLGKQTTCVGRDRELSVLEGIWAECVSERVARVALVTAPSGAGKSRLMHELLRRIAGPIAAALVPPPPSAGAPPMSAPSSFRLVPSSAHGPQVLHGRGDSLGAGSPFGMLAPAIRRSARIQRSEPLEVRRQKLRTRLSRHLPPAEVARLGPFLGELAGVSFSDEHDDALRVARADPMIMGDAMRAAFCEWLAAESAARPLLLILDDLHWGDLPSIRFVDSAVRQLRDHPLMVLALARPEVHAHFPGLWSERAVHEIRLGPLTKRASEKLVREVLGDAVSSDTAVRIAARAEGNAFYLEELIRAVAESNSEALPETVLGMVQARLNAVGTDQKRVLRAASVFGNTFSRAGVVALLGGEQRAESVGHSLDELVAREVLVQRRSETTGGDVEYSFRHALLCESAYAILTDSDRVLGHRLAGDWLEQQGEVDAMVLAEHFHRGGQGPRAMGWYRRAAEQALEGNDLSAALERAERGLACGAAGEARGALRLTQAEAHGWRGELAESELAAGEAATSLPEGGALWFRAVGEAIAAAGRRGLYERVAAWMARASEVSPIDAASAQIVCLSRGAMHLYDAGRSDLADAVAARVESLARDPGRLAPTAIAQVHAMRARRELRIGDTAACLTHRELALSSLQQAGDIRQACMTRVDIGQVYAELGAQQRAEETLRHALAAAEVMGLFDTAAHALSALGAVLLARDNVAEARSCEERAIEASKVHKNRRVEGVSRVHLARALLVSGALDQAEAEARTAAAVLEVAPPARAQAFAALAEVLIAKGRLPEALSWAREAATLLESVGGVAEGEIRVRLAAAVALEASGRHDGAREAIVKACDRLTSRASAIRDPSWRSSFLTNVPENARVLALSATWGCEPTID